MTSWPVHVDLLDRAILDLLCSLRATWREHDADALTGTQHEALRLLTEAGLVERRVWLTARMEDQPDEVDLTVVVSGEGVTPRIWERVFRAVPQWLDAEGRTRARVTLAASRVQIRLSDQGELARHDYEHQSPSKPSAVVAFVRRMGFHAHRPPVSPTVRVESCQVRAAAPGHAAPNATIIAAAQARTGDVTVNNVIQIDPAAVVAQVLAALAQQAPAAAGPAASGVSSPGTPPKPAASPKPSPGVMPKPVRRAGESFEWVCSEQPSLVPPEGSPERYTRKQHDYIREHGGPSYPLEGDQRSTVPSWDTRSRYVREYLRLMEGRRRDSRRRGESRSAVGPDDLDDRRDDPTGD
ncbi:MAG: hypothetical protein JNM80_04010 [Phycisphaerae bacterium]|nr:hypothetical protein [Phycisphaerae bacterium]